MPTLEKIQGAIIGGAENRVKNLETKTKLVTGTAAAISAVTADVGTLRFATDTGNLMVAQGSGNWVSPSSFSNGYSVDFDGSNDYMSTDIEIHDYDGSGSSLKDTGFSFAFWANIDAHSNMEFFGAMGSASDRVMFGIENSTSFQLGIGNLSTYLAHGMSTGTWYHLAVTWNTSGAWAVYRDGASIHTGTHTTWTPSTARTISIGALHYVWPYLYYYNGKMDEMGMWDKALTADEVTAIYNSGSPFDLTGNSGNYTSSGDLQAYWRMGDDDSGTGTTITDASGNGHHGTLVNSPAFSTTVPS